MRKSHVELLRIIGCLIVIGCHTCLSLQIGGTYNYVRILVSCLFADGAGVFFLITGFFLFKKGNYGSTLVKTVKRVVIPLTLYHLFVFYFYDFLFGDVSLVESIKHTAEEYRLPLENAIRFNDPFPTQYHLWYMYTYIFIMILFPILKSFADYLDKDIKHVRVFIIVSLAFLAVNQFTQNELFGFYHHTTHIFLPASLLVIYGHILYKNRSRFLSKQWTLVSISAFLVLNLLRAAAQYILFLKEPNNVYLFWYSAFGVLCQMSLAIFILSFLARSESREKEHNIDKACTIRKESIASRAVCAVSSLTFSVYLIHPLVITALDKYNLRYMIFEKLSVLPEFLVSFLYVVVCTAIIVAITLVIVLALKLIVIAVKKGYSATKSILCSKK